MSEDAVKQGGCQCGRIRYSADVTEADAYHCHCRLCQKATGGFAATFVMLPVTAVQWEQEPDWYASSPIAKRPYCSHCGSPLGFKFNDHDKMDLTCGSFDDPSRFRPTLHAGVEHLHEAWIDTSDLPRKRTDESETVTKRWKDAGLEMPE